MIRCGNCKSWSELNPQARTGLGMCSAIAMSTDNTDILIVATATIALDEPARVCLLTDMEFGCAMGKAADDATSRGEQH